MGFIEVWLVKTFIEMGFTKPRGTRREYMYQKLAYTTDYYIDESRPTTPKFPHWVNRRYHEAPIPWRDIHKVEIDESTAFNLTAVNSKFQITPDEGTRIHSLIKGKTLIVIGDSLGRQVLEFLSGILKAKECTYFNKHIVNFWGQKIYKPDCNRSRGGNFHQWMWACGHEDGSETRLSLIPHGKEMGKMKFQLWSRFEIIWISKFDI